MHHILAKLAMRPGLFVEHAAAYAELAGAELGATRQQWQRKAVAGAASLVAACMSLFLAATAAMLAAALPVAQMPAPWLLIVLPAVPAVIAVVGVMILRHVPAAPPFAVLREQMAQDLELFRRAGQA